MTHRRDSVNAASMAHVRGCSLPSMRPSSTTRGPVVASPPQLDKVESKRATAPRRGKLPPMRSVRGDSRRAHCPRAMARDAAAAIAGTS